MMLKVFVWLTCITQGTSFSFSKQSSSTRTQLSAIHEVSRRNVLIGTAGIMSLSSPAFAVAGPPTKAELDRIKVGYEGIEYLLANWEKETTVCRENGGECKRDAEPVRRYMGLRSTTDPLFQIEKVLAKVKYMDDIDIDDLETFFTATEEWSSAVNMSNSMAFISQFGEYNPGGGKDEVKKYLDESQKQVLIAQKSLKSIMTILKL